MPGCVDAVRPDLPRAATCPANQSDPQPVPKVSGLGTWGGPLGVSLVFHFLGCPGQGLGHPGKTGAHLEGSELAPSPESLCPSPTLLPHSSLLL